MLLKRTAFAHEAEVRLLAYRRDGAPGEPVLKVPFDPNLVFDSVAFDPRLELFERREREQESESLGYASFERDSGFYMKTILNIVVDQLPGAPPGP